MLSNVDRIKERLDITEVIGTYVKLEKAGKNFKAKSPFTNEKTPSFFVSPEKQLFYCFSSGKGGDMFTFVQEIEGVDFPGALKVLADRAGVELVFENKKDKDERETLYKIVETAVSFFQNQLEKTASAKDYIESRGITKESVLLWKIGYAPDDWRSLKDFLKSRGYSEADMFRAGLIKKTDEAKDSYDVFRDRIVFPIFDVAGRAVGFSGRILHKNDKSPKYLNSPDTELFNKSKILYGLHLAKIPIRKSDYTVLVEGQMDLVMSFQSGVKNTVASSGTAITEDHLKILQKISNRLVIAFDSDRAGFSAAERTAKIAYGLGMEVKAVPMSPGKDPADVVQESAENWKQVLKNKMPFIEYLLGQVKDGGYSSSEQRRWIKEKILPQIKEIPSSIDQGFYVSMVSVNLGLAESAIWDDLKKIPSMKNMIQGKTEDVEAVRTIVTTEEFVLGLLYWDHSNEKAFDSDFVEKEIERIAGREYILSARNKDEKEKQEIQFRLQIHLSKDENVVSEQEIKNVLKQFEVHILREKSDEINRKRVEAERQGKVDIAEALLKEQFELKKRIDKLGFTK